MLSISVYMSILVDIKALVTFKRWNTLYFWSLLITSTGTVFHSIAVALKWFVVGCPWGLYTAFSSFGWWGMITGQSLVLYSRLHLVIRDERILRAVLVMIIVDFALFQVPTTLLKFISSGTDTASWLAVYNVYERIQLAVFTVQELIISIIYIRAAAVWLSPNDPKSTRSTKIFLIYLNVLCIALDTAIIVEVSTDQWVYEEATQSLAYALKVTLEFAVLNKVMEVYRRGPSTCVTCRRRFGPTSLRNVYLAENPVRVDPLDQTKPFPKKESPVLARLRLGRDDRKDNRKRPSGRHDEEMAAMNPASMGVVTEIDAVSTYTSERSAWDCDSRGAAVTSDITTYIESGGEHSNLGSGRG